MSTALTLPLMTCRQFFELPDPAADFTYELHFGILVKAGRAKKIHFNLQMLIRDVLMAVLDWQRWLCEIELPYGLAPGYDARAADVGVVYRAKWDSADDFLIGSPALAVQAKSRSNRDRKLEEDAIVHITHGAAAVLLVKQDHREIIILTADSRTVYGPGQRIEIPAPLAVAIGFDDILPGA